MRVYCKTKGGAGLMARTGWCIAESRHWKEKQIWIPNCRGPFLIAGINCLGQYGHSEFEIFAPGRNLRFFIIVTVRELSGLWACPESHAFFYHTAVVKRTLASALYMEGMIIPRLSVFSGHECFQQGSLAWSETLRLTYHVYDIPSDVQLNDTIELVYGDYVTAGATTGAGSEIGKVVGTFEEDGDHVESEKGVDVPEMKNYITSSAIPKE